MLCLKWQKNWLQPAIFYGPRLTVFGEKEKKVLPWIWDYNFAGAVMYFEVNKSFHAQARLSWSKGYMTFVVLSMESYCKFDK